MQSYKIKSVTFFYTLWGMAIFSTTSSCFDMNNQRPRSVELKTIEQISKQNKKDCEDSAKIWRGELTGNEPDISISARITGLELKKLTKLAKTIAAKNINNENVTSDYVACKNSKELDTEKKLLRYKEK